MPKDFLRSTAIPIPKGKNINITDSNNYRGISLSSIFGKLFDLIVLTRYSDCLETCDLQFGFKSKRSTSMCSMVMKETISHYMNSNSTVHCVFLDASKAFDCVEYCKLFKLLTDRGLPSHVIRVLLNMYTGQQVRVLWNAVYIPIVSQYLMELSREGLLVQSYFVSILMFYCWRCVNPVLDVILDSGLLERWPICRRHRVVNSYISARAMRKMLSICDEFAINYNMKFNANKSKCLMFRPNRLTQGGKISTAESPVFEIGGIIIENVDRWTHLGHVINIYLTDDDDILSRRNCLIGQANNFLCQFSKLDSVIKNRLFKTYCSSMYGCEIWDLSSKEIEDLCVAWRRGTRKVWALPNDTSCDILCLIADVVPVFDEICRRLLNFIRSCSNCGSELISQVANFGVNFARMNSPIGRNSLFCSLRYGIALQDLCLSRLNSVFFSQFHISQLNQDIVAKAFSVIAQHKDMMRDKLNSVLTPSESLTCHDIVCGSEKHIAQLNNYSSQIIPACLESATHTIPSRSQSDGENTKVSPGWNEHASPARDKSLLWHIWSDCGRPRDMVSWLTSCAALQLRNAYHYMLSVLPKVTTLISLGNVLL